MSTFATNFSNTDGELDGVDAEVYVFPASFAQQRLWFLDQLEPGKPFYSISTAVRLLGSLQVKALEDSLNEIVQRHETLRTTFAVLDGELKQVITPATQAKRFTFSLFDLQDYAEEERENKILSLAHEEVQRPFDLARGPLIRGSLLILGQQDHVLFFTMQHIISDGWSFGVLMQELGTLYTDFAAGRHSSLPELPLQYADYAIWQKEWLQGEELQRQLSYWKQQLGDAPETVELFTDHARPSVQTFRGASQVIALPVALSQHLKTLALEEDATLFMVLLAAFQLLLYRYSGQDDIVIGTPIANRNRAEIEMLIGFFVNTLVLRTKLSANSSFHELLRRVREVALDAYAHQDLPFEQVVEILRPARDLSRSPLFQIMFALQNAQTAPTATPDLTFHPIAVDNGSAKFDLTLQMLDSEQGLVASLEYNTDLFETQTITDMLKRFQVLLTSIVTAPQQSISTLPIMEASEYTKLLSTWNTTDRAYALDMCVHQLFEQWAERSPEAIALVYADTKLSYADVNRRANQLAHYLLSLAVGPEKLLGLCVERSPAMLIALLAILKTGSAYVPLDPLYPAERLAYMLEDAQIAVLLTQNHLREQLPLSAVPYFYLDSAELDNYSDKNPSQHVLVEQLAYMIYTSGSTGQPKGVQITHANLLNLVFWHRHTYAITPTDRATQLAGIAFDACVWEIWPYLTAGASLYLPDNETRLAPEQLRDWLIEESITISFMPTPMAESVLTLPWPQRTALRALLVGGDKLRFYPDKALPFKLINHYGPTEFTVVTSAGEVASAIQQEQVPPIGWPIANTHIYILDQHLQPVPPGVPGELYVGGASLARGYLHRADLTAERFIPHPFSKHSGERLYRTGDRVRYLRNAAIEFLGRIDDQVKIRGYRIELGEIEAALLRHAVVRDCVVLARENTVGTKQLIAYVVSQDESKLTQADVRQYLLLHIPDYMVPTAIILLATLPLTPNGKVDRRALPAPEQAHLVVDDTYQEPHTATEQLLATIWKQVLGLERIGIHDNFFALGGDSILSIQIVARATRAGLRLTPKLLFQHQTIADLARISAEQQPAPISETEQGLVTGPVLLTPIEHWFVEQIQPLQHHWNQAMLVRVQRLDGACLKLVVKHLLAHHDALRLRLQQDGESWKQTNAGLDDDVPLTFLDLSTISTDEQKVAIEAAANEAQASLNITAGPLLRIIYFDLGKDQPSRLLLVIHHLAVDGVSWRILLEDFQLAYEQLSNGQTVQLPAKTTSFQHWAVKLHAYAQNPVLLQELDYWLAESRIQVHTLPVDLLATENTLDSARTVMVSLSPEETQALLYVVPQAYRTQINDILLTAFAQALTRWTKQSHVLVNIEGHGREDILDAVDISRTVGWFTSMYPILLAVDTNAHPATMLKALKEQLRHLPNRGIGYGLLRYLCENEHVMEQMRILPQAQISFNYLGQFDQATAEGSLFGHAYEASGPALNPGSKRPHLLDVSGSISGGQLHVSWIYSQHIHRLQTINALAQDFMQALRALIAHCRSQEAGGYTPSDFPLAPLTQEQIDTLLSNDRQVEAIYPLSPLQQGLLFHTAYAPHNGDYIVQIGCTFKGQLQADAFEQAWQHVVHKHTILRTAFLTEHLDEPLQMVRQHVELPFVQHDWRGYTVNEQQELLTNFWRADRSQGFILTHAPLMRLSLLRVADDTYEFLWSHHHLLLDGWSLPLLLNDVFAAYAALCNGETPQLERARPYQDYVQWLLQQDMQAAEVFWSHQLKGFTSPTQLQIEREMTLALAEEPPLYKEELHLLSADITEKLKQFSRQQQLTLNTLVLGAWTLLLSRYSGQSDVVAGTTVSGRPAELLGVESMVGLFINTLPVRVSFSAEQSILAWLHGLQELQMEMRQYEYSSLTQIQRWSDMPRGTALFNNLFVFENYPIANNNVQAQESELAVQALQSQEQTNYPLTLVAHASQHLSLKLIYDSLRFEPTDIQRLLAQLHTLLENFTVAPERYIVTTPLLTAAEQQQLLHEWNATETRYPQEATISALFEAQTERDPDALALSAGSEQLSYQDLNRRANQLARHLRTLGVGPETLVGVYMQRSPEMILGLLGILKAGGAYVPLDPTYPSERLAFMLQDAQITVLLTQQHLLESLPLSLKVHHTLDLQLQRSLFAHYPADNLEQKADTGYRAYMIYTSGSTGRPKGVQITHASLLNLLFWHQRTYEVSPHDRATQLAGVAFDASVWEIWPYLTAGASLHIPEEETRLAPTLLRDWLINQDITITFLPTPLAERLLLLSWPPKVPLRLLLTGGDTLHAVPLKTLPFQLINHYGPTEATVVTTAGEVPGDVSTGHAPTIGKTIANTQGYVLDHYLQPVPIGVAGELYVGGTGLAQGYLHQPALTAERFIAHPFSQEAGQRLYKTGDLVKYRQDGALVFLGRLDAQVKMHGYRIELGEIENVLRQHPAIAEDVVQVREMGGEKRLVAYVVAKTSSQIDQIELYQYLQERLPMYMVPALWVQLEALPLTSNGKVDRAALPEPDSTHVGRTGAHETPRNPLEERLTTLWQQVLGIETIGIHDNFFMLGGDSILSMQIVSRASQDGLHLTPRLLFQHQTIAELASVVTEGRAPSAHTAEQGLVTGEAPLTPIQHWFFAQALPAPSHYNQAMLLSVRHPLDPQWLEQTVQQLVRQHDALRMRFKEQGNSWQQNHAELENLPLVSYRDLSDLPGEELNDTIEIIANQIQTSLHLSAGPLLRLVSFDLGAERAARLLLVIHHLVVDGVSWRILLEDLEQFYEQISSGYAASPPMKTTSFQYWAQGLVDYAQTATLQQEMAYWLAQSRQQIQPFPQDEKGGENTIASVQTITAALSIEETQALLHEVPQAYRTQMNDVLLTALMLTMEQWTGQSSLLIDLEGHGREEILANVDLSRTVGWFTSMYPVLLNGHEQQSLPTTLKSIKEQLRAIPQHGIGYGLLRYLCKDPYIVEQMQSLPQAEISFNYLGQFMPHRTLDQEDHAHAPLFSPTHESSGLPASPLGHRAHLFDISGSISADQLYLSWAYSSNTHHPETVERLMQNYLHTLRTCIEHCRLAEAGGYTPTDFPLAGLTQKQIDSVLGNDRGIEAVYPLSPLQQGLLFHTLYTPSDGSYIVQTNFTFQGQIRIDAFKDAWQYVIDRYAILRTAFIWDGLDEPQQIVHRQVETPFVYYDWRQYASSEQQERLTELRQQDRVLGFTLAQAPLLRLTLVRLAAESYEFLWSHHHLLLDGWSLPIVLKDVFVSYEALCQDKNILWEHVHPYQDYIAWLLQQDLSQAQEFWQRSLQGFIAPTLLTIEHRRQNEIEQAQYKELQGQVSLELTQALQQLARHQQLTLNTVMQGMWALLLSHYSAQDDIVFGATVSGRPSAITGIEAMVGLFINTLPIRIRINPQMSLQAWLQDLQRQQSELRQYEYTPLVQIQGWSDVLRGLPLFETLFVFENYPITGRNVQEVQASLQVQAIRSQEQTHYPLTLYIIPGQNLTFKLVYDQNRFDAVGIEHMFQHLKNLLQGLADNSAQPLHALSLLSNTERQRLLVEWNTTLAEYPSHNCIHEVFEQCVERNPAAVAVVTENAHITYHELNQRANQLAHYLQAAGVLPDTLIGLCIEPSLEMLIAMLGILKAGGAYVPLDPAYPQNRLAFMLNDAGLAILVTQARLLTALPAHTMHTIKLDTDWVEISHSSSENLQISITADNLAYAIYTSGSTGTPKGVLACHRAALNRFMWMWKEYPFEAGERCCQRTSLNFVDAVWELLGPVLQGVQLTIIPAEARQDPLLFVRHLAATECTRVVLVPSLLQAILASVPEISAQLPKLKLCICSGETLPIELARNFKELLPQSQLLNLYGSSEVSADVTYYDTSLLTDAQVAVPIGRPIANMHVYLLDRHQQLVPAGVAGEVYVGGIGLARGYLNQPGMTAERFIPDPFALNAGARLYRTGDIAHYLPDGTLEYLGRTDQQVKIRGFRIELSEIESRLREHSAIHDAIVLARRDLRDDTQLVAYIVSSPEMVQTQLSAQLRTFLQQHLPDYMLPTSFISLEAFPLLPNGKVNRHALPPPSGEHSSTITAYEAPRTAMEELLVEIWADVLKREHIGIHDNFFEIGGHSLLATQVISRIRMVFQVEIPVRSLFENPTVASLLITIAQKQVAQTDDAMLAQLLAELDELAEDDLNDQSLSLE